jgi:hypothetical protein
MICRILDIRGNNFEPATIGLAGTGGIILTRDCAMRESNIREQNAFFEWTIRADEAERRIARAMRICVGNELRQIYGHLPNDPIPPRIADLLRRLER